MALFSKKTKEAPKAKAEKAVKVAKTAVVTTSGPSLYDVTAVIVSPRITEKAAIQAEKGIYVFNISTTATKPQIARAITELYKVTPMKVRVAGTPAKKTFIRGKVGTKSGVRKAYVYLKKGDKIEIA